MKLYRLRYYHSNHAEVREEFLTTKLSAVREGNRVAHARIFRNRGKWHEEPHVECVTIRSSRSPRMMMWRAACHIWDSVEEVWAAGGAT